MSTVAETFAALATQWAQETGHLSNMHTRAMHQAYQQIIGLGPAVVPFILERFTSGDLDDWFWALTAITGENPITPEIAGNIPQMAEAWVAWGSAHGVIGTAPPGRPCPSPAMDTVAVREDYQELVARAAVAEQTIVALRREVEHLEGQVKVAGSIVAEWKAKCAALEKELSGRKGRLHGT